MMDVSPSALNWQNQQGRGEKSGAQEGTRTPIPTILNIEQAMSNEKVSARLIQDEDCLSRTRVFQLGPLDRELPAYIGRALIFTD